MNVAILMMNAGRATSHHAVVVGMTRCDQVQPDGAGLLVGQTESGHERARHRRDVLRQGDQADTRRRGNGLLEPLRAEQHVQVQRCSWRCQHTARDAADNHDGGAGRSGQGVGGGEKSEEVGRHLGPGDARRSCSLTRCQVPYSSSASSSGERDISAMAMQ